MTQYQLLSGPTKDDSFGLDTLQIYNWGTYNGEINEIRPNLLASWLTGMNGAGKSTILDSISTLLTPPIKRQYNMSSGAEKAERSEKTYVRGAWGEKRDENSQQDEIKYLRAENSYSVLLARFETPKTKRVMTLAQVLWLHSDSVKKIYITCTQPLDIKTHFSGFENPKTLKLKLKEYKEIQIFDTFQEYSASFMKVFGMRSTQAVELINKTASMKEIESLTDFMRSNMLERIDMGPTIKDLINHFKVAEDAHRNFAKARVQTTLLEPLEKYNDTHKIASLRISDLSIQLDVIWPFIYKRLIEILKDKLLKFQDELEILKAKEKEQEDIEISKQASLRKIQETLQGHKTSNAIEKLDLQKKTLLYSFEMRKADLKRYSIHAEQLKLPLEPNAVEFVNSKRFAHTVVTESAEASKSIQEGCETSKNTQRDFGKKIESLRIEYDAIEKRPSNIPEQNLRIRATICQYLGVTEDKIPFAGELIKVNKKEWQGACERLLRSFGLLVLIEDQYYEKTLKFVNSNNLKGKLEFERIESNKYEVTSNKKDDSFIFSKIDVKPKSIFNGWISYNLRKRFNYVCCDSIEELMQTERSITREGLIRHSFSRHLKDDRHSSSDPSSYILGWDNKEKIKLLKNQIEEAALAYSKYQQEINDFNNKIESYSIKIRLADALLHFENFEQIDCPTLSKRISEIDNEISDLEASNKDLKILRKKELETSKEIEIIKDKLKTLVGDTRSKNDAIQNIKNDIQNNLHEIAKIDKETIESYFPLLEERCENLTINFSKEDKGKIYTRLSKSTQQSKEEQEAIRNSASISMTQVMRKFKDTYPQDSTDLLPNIEYIESYLEVYHSLLEDDLPRFEAEYRAMFTKDVLDRVTLFHTELYKRDAEIKESIEFINSPLENVIFNAGTRIRICAKSTDDRIVKEFQIRLRDCLPKITISMDQGQQDEAYSKVQSLVDYLQKPETERERNRVLDVRAWVEFSAEEFDAGTGNMIHYYSGAAGRSGGQKAQLAFTVLASALAYQCGMTADAPSENSFNFVMVDEAFAKTDSKKSDMAIKLFKNMGFQLLVSSPDRDGDIVEPHIDCIHVAYCNVDRNHSKIYTLSLEEVSKRLGRNIGKKKMKDEDES